MTDAEQKAAKSIILACDRGAVAARRMVQELVECGATNEQIKSAVENLGKQATSEAIVLISRRDAAKKIAGLP